MYFVNGAEESVEYTYDGNGNMISDKNKQIESVEYNELNLPSRILQEKKYGLSVAGRPVNFTREIISNGYDASGRKLETRYETEIGQSLSGSSSLIPGGSLALSLKNKTDYCENFIYQNDTLSKILTPEGYISIVQNVLTPNYYLRDHQGNVRVVMDHTCRIRQVNHYYPFGGLMDIGTGGEVQRYKFGGKELERMNNLDLYDFSARLYDPVLCRFTTPDPLCEQYYSVSPYVYCLNNPVKYVDPTGMFSSTHTDMYGAVVGVYNDGDLGVYRHAGNREETLSELKNLYSLNNISAGGVKMGETYVWNSFVNGKNEPDGTISFNSWEANRKVFGAVHSLAQNSTSLGILTDYALNASNGELYDLKSKASNVYNGSLFQKGKYVSNRDAGNILAGMAARMGGLSAKTTYTLFGAFELSQNSRTDMWKYISRAREFGETKYYGEKPVSHSFQKFGYEFFKF